MRSLIEGNPDECDAKFFKQYFDALKAIGGTPSERTKMPKDKDNTAKDGSEDDDDGSQFLT